MREDEDVHHADDAEDQQEEEGNPEEEEPEELGQEVAEDPMAGEQAGMALVLDEEPPRPDERRSVAPSPEEPLDLAEFSHLGAGLEDEDPEAARKRAKLMARMQARSDKRAALMRQAKEERAARAA